MSNKKFKKEMNPAKRVLISAASVLVVVAVVGGLIYKIKKAGDNAPEISVSEGPNINSKPGLGSPTKIYNDEQIKENVQNAKEAKQKVTSNVPTLTNSDFNGDISSFLSSNQAEKAACPVGKLDKGFKPNPKTCEISNLRLARKAGVSAAELICQSCSVQSLRDAGYTIGDLKNGGHSAKELKEAGFNLSDLLAAGYSPAELKEAGFSAESLRAMGLSANQLAAAGCSFQDLLDSGVSPQIAKKAIAVNEALNQEAMSDARDSGLSADSLLQKGVPLAALKKAGYSARELMSAGATLKQLKDAGFSVQDLAQAGYSVDELKNAGFSAGQLEKIAEIAKQCSLTQLKAEHVKGTPIANLLKVCQAEALRAAGYTLNELVKAGVNPKVLRQAGYSAKDLLNAGYDAKSLLDAGYSVKSLKEAGVALTSLLAAGASPAELLKAGFLQGELNGQGITAERLLQAGLTPAELKKAGFSATELAAAGANAGSLQAAGFSAKELRPAGFSASQMRQAGYSAKELREAGYSLQDLKIAGYTSGDLIRAGFENIDTTVQPKIEKQVVQGEPTNLSNFPVIEKPSVPNKEEIELDRIRAIQKYQQQQMDKSQQNALLQSTASKMSSQARSLMSDWSQVSSQSLTQAPKATAEGGAGRGGAGGTGSSKATGPTFKAGTVMYGVLDTSVDSDEQTPIMAKIMSGELKGAKLIGSFKRVDKKVMLTFNLLNIPGFKHTVSFQGVAIDPATARTALSGSVNNHYFLKYGTTFITAFMSGLGNAVSGGTSNCQIWNPGGSADPWCQTVYNKLNVTQSALSGLGNVGQKLSGQLQQDFGNIPPTIKIPGGTAFGLLFTSDLTLPQPLPKPDPLTNMNNLMGETNE